MRRALCQVRSITESYLRLSSPVSVAWRNAALDVIPVPERNGNYDVLIFAQEDPAGIIVSTLTSILFLTIHDVQYRRVAPSWIGEKRYLLRSSGVFSRIQIHRCASRIRKISSHALMQLILKFDIKIFLIALARNGINTDRKCT